jgi:hypothetical protein
VRRRAWIKIQDEGIDGPLQHDGTKHPTESVPVVCKECADHFSSNSTREMTFSGPRNIKEKLSEGARIIIFMRGRRDPGPLRGRMAGTKRGRPVV